MLGHVAALGDQLLDGRRAGLRASVPALEGCRAIVVCGMGGSGQVGDVIGALAGTGPRPRLPLCLVKEGELPAFCDERTYVIAISFSGNTEETLACHAAAVERGCRTVGLSAGGELATRCRDGGLPHAAVPGGVPVPRAALGLQVGACLGVLERAGLPVGFDLPAVADRVGALAATLAPERPAATNPAKELAAWLGSRTPLVWGSGGPASVAALRWKTQANENAKRPSFAATFPELDHNEIEGWSPRTGSGYGLFVLRHGGEPPGMAARIEATLAGLEESGAGLDVRQVDGPGESPAERLFSLVMLGDFVMTYLALGQGIDPTPIPVLSSLKDRLRRGGGVSSGSS